MNTNLRMDYATLRGLAPDVHRPACLAILKMLRDREVVRYIEFKERLALSTPNLSDHARNLEDARLVNVGKRIKGKERVVTFNLTLEGVAAIEAYWAKVAILANRSAEWGKVGAWNA
jgi:DNA-binding MarR family transcriptional regulator